KTSPQRWITRVHRSGTRAGALWCQPRWATRAEFNLLNISGRTAHPLFMWATAFGIKSAIRGIDSFEALSSCRNGPSNGAIIRLALDHQRISAGRKHEFLLLWPND